MRNKRLLAPTRVNGAGQIISELYEGIDRCNKAFCNFLVRADDGPILRLQFWGVSSRQFADNFRTRSLKGLRIEFNGRLSGTYDEKPTVVVTLEAVEVGSAD
jgi:hypothetical protein